MGKTFAINNTMDLVIEEYAASGRGTILDVIDYAKSTNIAVTSERIDITGGQGNFQIIGLDHSKKTALNIMLPIVSLNTLAIKLGRSVSTGASTYATKTECLVTAGATPTITLSATPTSGTLVVYTIASGTERDLDTIQTAGTPATTENEYSISGTEITLNSTTAPAGTHIWVSYDYTSGANAENLKITANDFPTFITIRGKGILEDDQANLRVPVSFIIHKAKVRADFELTMANDAATEVAFDCDCYTIKDCTNNERVSVNITKLVDEGASTL